MIKQIMIFIMLATLSSCGTKIKIPVTDIVNETDSYIAETNSDTDLEKTSSEGVLTDASGFKDKGKYTLNTYYNKLNNDLYRIENIETTDKVIAENFYFKDNQLVFISAQTNTEVPAKLYVYKDKIINEPNLGADFQKILMDKAKIFNKEFKKAH